MYVGLFITVVIGFTFSQFSSTTFLRFGAYFDKEGNNTDYIFSFLLEEEDGKYELIETIIGPPKDQEEEYIDNFLARIWGIN